MIIAVAQSKGGTGKSTIAFNLAGLLSKNYKVKIIDLDSQKTLTCANTLRAKSKKPFELVDICNQEELKKIILNNKDLYIIDTGGFDSDLNRLAIIGADLLLTPVSNKGFDIMGLMNFQNTLEKLSKAKKDDIISYVLINNVDARTQSFTDLKKTIETSKHFIMLDSIIRQRVAVTEANTLGLGIAEYQPKSKGAKEIKALVKELLLKVETL